MSMDRINVSLSRLALAKAIKTPDGNESNTMPWTRSIIFYQPHVPRNMLESLHSQHHRITRTSGFPGLPTRRNQFNAQRHNGSQGQDTRQTSSEWKPQGRSIPNLADRQSQERRPNHSKRNSQSPSVPHTQSSVNLPSTTEKSMPTAHVTRSAITLSYNSPDSSKHGSSKSGDTSSENSDTDEIRTPRPKSSMSNPILGQTKTQNRPLHREPRDSNSVDSDTDHTPIAIPTRPHSSNALGMQKQAHGQRQIEQRNVGRPRPRSTGDMARMLQDTEQIQDEPIRPMSVPQKFTGTHLSANRNSGSSSSSGSATSSSHSRPASIGYQVLPESISRNQGHFGNAKLPEADPIYLHNQIQQYHQVAQFTPKPYPTAHRTRTHDRDPNNPKRYSANAMDLLKQREIDREELLKKKTKRFDASNAKIDGVLGRIPERGTHNINFQSKKTTSKPNFVNQVESKVIPQHVPTPGSRTPPKRTQQKDNAHSHNATDARRRAEMKRNSNEHKVLPKPSYSTPVNQMYLSLQPQVMYPGVYHGAPHNMGVMDFSASKNAPALPMNGFMPVMHNTPSFVSIPIQQQYTRDPQKKNHRHMHT